VGDEKAIAGSADHARQDAVYRQQTKIHQMWIVFREDKSEFVNLDKHVVALVNDLDILTYQHSLGGYLFALNTDVNYLQEFVRHHDGVLYFARRYDVARIQ
jgi:hypothetical protein